MSDDISIGYDPPQGQHVAAQPDDSWWDAFFAGVDVAVFLVGALCVGGIVAYQQTQISELKARVPRPTTKPTTNRPARTPRRRRNCKNWPTS